MVSTILKRSLAVSIIVWLFLAGVGVPVLLHDRVNNFFFAGIFIAPFVMTLIWGAIQCLFRTVDQLKNESVSYILFKYSFQGYFDDWCILALNILCFYAAFSSNIDIKYIYIIYVLVCVFVTWSDSGDYNSNDPDVIESDRISSVKVFLLSLALSPIVGYIAVRMYKSEQSKKTDTMKRHLERAEAYLEAKDYTNAILECQEGLNGTGEFGRLDEGNFAQREVRYDILHVLAKIYCEQEKYSEALESYENAMFVFPHDLYKARMCVLPIVHPIGKKWASENQARRVLDTYERLFPNDERFEEERIQLTHNTSMADAAVSCAENAMKHFEQKDYASAIDDYTKVIEIVPEGTKSAFIYKQRAEVYLAQKNYADAIADCTKAIELAPEDGKFYYYGERAAGYLAQKEYANAISDYTKAIELAPKASKSYYYEKRAKAYREQEDYASAIADYTKAIEFASEDKKSGYYGIRAKAYREQEDYVSAIADYTKAIEFAAEDNLLYYYEMRAKMYLVQKDYANAVADYTKAIELVPNSSYCYDQRGKAHQQLGNTEQAEADFAKAKELEEKQENE